MYSLSTSMRNFKERRQLLPPIALTPNSSFIHTSSKCIKRSSTTHTTLNHSICTSSTTPASTITMSSSRPSNIRTGTSTTSKSVVSRLNTICLARWPALRRLWIRWRTIIRISSRWVGMQRSDIMWMVGSSIIRWGRWASRSTLTIRSWWSQMNSWKRAWSRWTSAWRTSSCKSAKFRMSLISSQLRYRRILRKRRKTSLMSISCQVSTKMDSRASEYSGWARAAAGVIYYASTLTNYSLQINPPKIKINQTSELKA